MTPNDSTTGSDQALQKHCIHMEQAVWEQAGQTAHSLGLSTSQFLSRLVDETRGAIKSGSLLDLEPNSRTSARS